jgi:hypothetical protein
LFLGESGRDVFQCGCERSGEVLGVEKRLASFERAGDLKSRRSHNANKIETCMCMWMEIFLKLH